MYKVDRSIDGIDWEEKAEVESIPEALRIAEAFWEEGFDVTVWDAEENKVYEHRGTK